MFHRLESASLRQLKNIRYTVKKHSAGASALTMVQRANRMLAAQVYGSEDIGSRYDGWSCIRATALPSPIAPSVWPSGASCRVCNVSQSQPTTDGGLWFLCGV